MPSRPSARPIKTAPFSGWGQYGGLLEATVALALVASSNALLDVAPSLPLLLAAFLGTFAVYLADRGLGFSPEDRWNDPDRVIWRRRYRRSIQVVLLATGGGCLLALAALRTETLVLSGGIGLAACAYVVPILPGGKRLKALLPAPWILVTLAWALGAVLLPVVEAGGQLTWTIWALFLYRLLYLLPNVLVSSWIDGQGDARAGLGWRKGRGIWRISVIALLCAITGGLGALMAGWAPPLIAIDVVGPVMVLIWLLTGAFGAPRYFQLGLDALMAWPALTAVVWAMGLL